MNTINFDQLISPVSAKEFFQEFWEKTFLHIKRESFDLYKNVLTVEDLDNLLSRHDLTPYYVNLYKNEKKVPSDSLVVQDKIDENTLNYLIDPGKLFAQFNTGATIVITAGERSIKDLGVFCNNLSQNFQIRFQANIYITPPESQCFFPHYDLRDVFILQIHGNKHWKIYQSSETLPVKANLPFPEEPEIINELILKSGELLYLPRGTMHSATSTETTSVHITLSGRHFEGWRALQTLIDRSQKDLFFRHSIPNKFNDSDEKDKFVDTFLKKTSQMLEDFEGESLFSKQKENFVKNQFIDYRQNFSDILSLDKITLQSKVVRKKNLSYLIEKEGKEAILKFGKQEFKFPIFMLATMEKCFQGEPFEVRELKGLIKDSGKIELVKNLLKIGFLKRVRD